MTLLKDASWDQGEECPHCKGIGMYGSEANDLELVEIGEACPYCEGTGHTIICGECGNPLELVRPGKFQCNYCEW